MATLHRSNTKMNLNALVMLLLVMFSIGVGASNYVEVAIMAPPSGTPTNTIKNTARKCKQDCTTLTIIAFAVRTSRFGFHPDLSVSAALSGRRVRGSLTPQRCSLQVC